jgi:hypothetical protein
VGPIQRSADYNSAIRQIENLRYGKQLGSYCMVPAKAATNPATIHKLILGFAFDKRLVLCERGLWIIIVPNAQMNPLISTLR